MRHYDVIIVGGSVLGLIVALYCVDAGLRVAIIENTPYVGGYYKRSITNMTHVSSARSMSLFERFGFRTLKNVTPHTFQLMVQRMISYLIVSRRATFLTECRVNSIWYHNPMVHVQTESLQIANRRRKMKAYTVIDTRSSSSIEDQRLAIHDAMLRQTLLEKSHVTFPIVSEWPTKAIHQEHAHQQPIRNGTSCLICKEHFDLQNEKPLEDTLVEIETFISGMLEMVIDIKHHFKPR